MTILQTVLVYVGIPVAVLALFAALTLWPKAQRNPRYRSGEAWEYPPVWWSANPDGLKEHAEVASDSVGAHALGSGTRGAHSRTTEQADVRTSVVGGGARGTW